MKDNKKGFTLIELLAVIAILAILMLLVTPRLVKSIKSSKKDTFYDNVTLIYNTAILEYVDDNAKNDEYCDTCSNNLGNKIPNKFEYDVKFEEDKLIYIRITDKEYIYVKSDENGINKKDLNKDDIKEYDPNENYDPDEDYDENGFKRGTLVAQLFVDHPLSSIRTDFSKPFVDNVSDLLYKDYENKTKVYYYTGKDTSNNSINNWVKFGKYQKDLIKYRGYYDMANENYREYSTLEECTSSTEYNTNCTAYKYGIKGDDMYWRIIRTNSDGSIKLLYSGTNPNTTLGHIGISKFNENSNSPKDVGYMYGDTDATLEEARTNTNDSTIKTYIDNWYENYFADYTNYLSKDAVYCNDRELASGNTYSKVSSLNFISNFRTNRYSITKEAQPSYNCTNNKDAFSGNNTEAKLKYPIALMTIDEIVFAGGISQQQAPLWYYTNNAYESITDKDDWWTLSPNYYSMKHSYLWRIEGSKKPGRLMQLSVRNFAAVRPVTSLKSCVKWKSGDGSANNPYEILENGGC